MTTAEALLAAKRRLAKAGIEDATLDAAVLLHAAAGITRAMALTHPEKEITEEEEERFFAMVSRREKREPAAYITGHQEFMGLTYQTGRGVLIPRADTETLVEEAMLHLHDGMRILDLCTGTGCVALSLLHYSNDTWAAATDCAPDALILAAKNAVKLQLSERFFPMFCDLYPDATMKRIFFTAAGDPPESRFDLVVANPPYIRREDLSSLMPEVRDYEPSIALNGGDDGLLFYRRILSGLAQVLTPNGWLLTEIGYDQADSVRALFEEAGLHGVEIIRDAGGNDRVVKGCYY